MTLDGYDLSGRVAIVTGGGEGIGAATTRLLARYGANVVIAGRTAAKIERTSAEINSLTGRHCCLGVATDIRDEGQVARMVTRTIEEFGRIDILVNNAAWSTPCRLSDLDSEHWRSDFAFNVDGAFYCTKEASQHFRAQGSGAIVNVSSLAGETGAKGFGGYSAAKAALQMLTRVAAAEWGPLGIRVNCVAPGLIATETAVRESKAFNMDMASISKSFPLRRPGKPEEVANAIVFLASDAAAYITGVTLLVSGGSDL